MKTAASFIVIIALGLLSYFVAKEWDHLFPESEAILVNSHCDLSVEACLIDLPDGGTVELALSPTPIVLMAPLHVDVRVENSQFKPEYIDITGLNMEMGVNRTRLQPQQTNYWKGETILPVCSQRRMHWQAKLQLIAGDKRYHLAYKFYTTRL